jgi:hypothetical protein
MYARSERPSQDQNEGPRKRLIPVESMRNFLTEVQLHRALVVEAVPFRRGAGTYVNSKLYRYATEFRAPTDNGIYVFAAQYGVEAVPDTYRDDAPSRREHDAIRVLLTADESLRQIQEKFPMVKTVLGSTKIFLDDVDRMRLRREASAKNIRPFPIDIDGSDMATAR